MSTRERIKEWTGVPDPAICGTDLHIRKGDVPTVTTGRVLGHEAVGTVVEVGAAVTGVRPGDRVLAPCICACGRCAYCRTGHYGQCQGGGGWILGHLIDGVQAQFARIPVRRHVHPPAARQRHRRTSRAAGRHPAHLV